MAYNPRLARQARKARGSGDVKLNITSMMDMFTIILVFLLKSYSTEGQLVTPATGLLLPTSSVERTAKEALCVKISNNNVSVENTIVLDEKSYQEVMSQKDFMIPKLHEVLTKYAEEAQKTAEMFGKDFSGEITIQGDIGIPYKLLTRIMYTCGQSGYPVMNLIVYREE
jgi:biopolymer transport protein ExbD